MTYDKYSGVVIDVVAGVRVCGRVGIEVEYHQRGREQEYSDKNAICVIMWFWCTKGLPCGEGGALFRKAASR